MIMVLNMLNLHILPCHKEATTVIAFLFLCTYILKLCEAAFAQNVSLKTHKRSAHGINMWKGKKTSL